MSVWSINIIPGERDGLSVFAPDVFGLDPGDPLRAQANDAVSWSNRTEGVHQPWPADAQWQVDNNGQGLCELIQPWTASTPAYLVVGNANTTLNYVCLIHPDERGQIVIV
jgi:hypothetical protein